MSRKLLAPLLPILLVVASAAAGAGHAPPPKKRPFHSVDLVLSTTQQGERTVEADEFKSAYFKRSFRRQAAPRAETPGGQTVEIRDKRSECRCLRLDDWSQVKFKKLRQIEILYPQDKGEALLRLTYRDGRLKEIKAGSLYGSQTGLPPLLVATVKGTVLEYPLILTGHPEARWPEETLTRVLFVHH